MLAGCRVEGVGGGSGLVGFAVVELSVLGVGGVPGWVFVSAASWARRAWKSASARSSRVKGLATSATSGVAVGTSVEGSVVCACCCAAACLG